MIRNAMERSIVMLLLLQALQAALSVEHLKEECGGLTIVRDETGRPMKIVLTEPGEIGSITDTAVGRLKTAIGGETGCLVRLAKSAIGRAARVQLSVIGEPRNERVPKAGNPKSDRRTEIGNQVKQVRAEIGHLVRIARIAIGKRENVRLAIGGKPAKILLTVTWNDGERRTNGSTKGEPKRANKGGSQGRVPWIARLEKMRRIRILLARRLAKRETSKQRVINPFSIKKWRDTGPLEHSTAQTALEDNLQRMSKLRTTPPLPDVTNLNRH